MNIDWILKRLNEFHKVVWAIFIIPILLISLVGLSVTTGSQAIESLLPGPKVFWLLQIAGWIMLAMGLENILDGAEEERIDRQVAADNDPRDLKVRLMWKHQFQFCGFYHAAESNRHLKLREGGSPKGLDPIACVVEQFDTFGVTTAIDLIRQYQSNTDVREAQIVPCLVIFQLSPMVMLAPRLRNFHLNELNGAKIAFYGRADPTFREFGYLAQSRQLAYKPVFLEDARDLREPLAGLRDGTTTYRVGYAFNEGLHADWATDYHRDYVRNVFQTNVYADVLFTRLETLNTRKEEVVAMCNAIRSGYAICADQKNEHEVLELMRLYCKDQLAQFEVAMTENRPNPFKSVIASLMKCHGAPPAGSCLIGSVNDWQRMEDLVTGKSGSFTEFLIQHQLFDILK